MNTFYTLARKVEGLVYFNLVLDRFNAQSLKCKKKSTNAEVILNTGTDFQKYFYRFQKTILTHSEKNI